MEEIWFTLINSSMRQGSIIEHKDKTVGASGYSHDNLYYFMGECRMKLPCGEWVDAIRYDDIRTKSVYIREKNDFYNKFKEYEGKN